MEEAAQRTVYAPIINPYTRKKDGRDAWKSMVSSHAGQDKWEQLQKERLNFLMKTKWNGRVYSLEKFVGLHRNSFVQLQEYVDPVNFQLQTYHSIVVFLIDNTSNSDPYLRAAIASVCINTNNKRDDFEGDLGFLLPVCPYAKHRNECGRSTSNIWGANISNATLRGKSSSKTGIYIRCHKRDEYAEISSEQKHKLYEWKKSKDGKEFINQYRKKYNNSKTRHSSNTTYKYLQ